MNGQPTFAVWVPAFPDPRGPKYDLQAQEASYSATEGLQPLHLRLPQ